MKTNNQVPDRDNASIMRPLRNLEETDMDISLIELLFHVSFDCSGKGDCHINPMMGLRNIFFQLKQMIEHCFGITEGNYAIYNG